MYMWTVLTKVNPGINQDSCSQTVTRNTWGDFLTAMIFAPSVDLLSLNIRMEQLRVFKLPSLFCYELNEKYQLEMQVSYSSSSCGESNNGYKLLVQSGTIPCVNTRYSAMCLFVCRTSLDVFLQRTRDQIGVKEAFIFDSIIFIHLQHLKLFNL